ncbi:MAG TPA: DinB family protein [Acidimicrobiia bacterium]|jgi:hypothetical protein
MSHFLVDQLRFARSEFRRGLFDVSEADGSRSLQPMNTIGWTVGHLAWQEERYWLRRARQVILNPRLDQEFAYGRPASTPSVTESWEAWDQVVAAADDWLNGLDDARMSEPLAEGFSNVGTFLLRTIYHYWYHLGEMQAARQLLGHTGLPDFVGDIDVEAPWTGGV